MKVKSIINPKSAKATVEFLKKAKVPFQIIISNYTTEIKSEIQELNQQYVKSMRSPKCFAAFIKIKSELKDKVVPKINKAELQYFEHNFREPQTVGDCMNIDIRSCYAAILHNDKYISTKMFDYLNTIPKLDRLAAVGMLASKKWVFNYNKYGQLENYEKLESDTANFFFHSVIRTAEIMNELRQLCKYNYLFTWVDSIYFKPDNVIMWNLFEYLESINLKYSMALLHQFAIRMQKTKIVVDYWKHTRMKGGAEICKKKSIGIPSQNGIFATELIYYLTNINVNEKEDSKIPVSCKSGKRFHSVSNSK